MCLTEYTCIVCCHYSLFFLFIILPHMFCGVINRTVGGLQFCLSFNLRHFHSYLYMGHILWTLIYQSERIQRGIFSYTSQPVNIRDQRELFPVIGTISCNGPLWNFILANTELEIIFIVCKSTVIIIMLVIFSLIG